MIAGFVTTDGTLGALFPANILDYEIDVTGPTPYKFVPSSPFAFEIVDGVSATATDLSVDIETSVGGVNFFSFEAQDNADPACQACVQRVNWTNQNPVTGSIGSFAGYSFSDQDAVPSNSDATTLSQPQEVIVVASVPEPASIMLSLFGLFVVGLATRKRT